MAKTPTLRDTAELLMRILQPRLPARTNTGPNLDSSLGRRPRLHAAAYRATPTEGATRTRRATWRWAWTRSGMSCREHRASAAGIAQRRRRPRAERAAVL